MSDDGFNMSMRKFLKQVGVTSQQEIEAAVRRAAEAGTLPGGDLTAVVELKIEGVGLVHRVDGKITPPGDG